MNENLRGSLTEISLWVDLASQLQQLLHDTGRWCYILADAKYESNGLQVDASASKFNIWLYGLVKPCGNATLTGINARKEPNEWKFRINLAQLRHLAENYTTGECFDSKTNKVVEYSRQKILHIDSAWYIFPLYNSHQELIEEMKSLSVPNVLLNCIYIPARKMYEAAQAANVLSSKLNSCQLIIRNPTNISEIKRPLNVSELFMKYELFLAKQTEPWVVEECLTHIKENNSGKEQVIIDYKRKGPPSTIKTTKVMYSGLEWINQLYHGLIGMKLRPRIANMMFDQYNLVWEKLPKHCAGILCALNEENG
jgi:hypothetical protein